MKVPGDDQVRHFEEDLSAADLIEDVSGRHKYVKRYELGSSRNRRDCE